MRLNPSLTEKTDAERSAQEEASEERPVENRLREPISILVILLLCLCAVTLFKPDGDPDIWARMAVGKLIIESGEVPTTDPFSYTPKKAEWIDHEWGAGVVFYLVASLGGQKALLLLRALLMFGTVMFMYLRSRLDTGRAPSLIFHILVLGALYFGFMASVRAQAFSFFLFSAWLYLLERARDGDWRFVWLIPVSAVVWANLHGGFLAGIGLLILFTVGELMHRRAYLRFGALAAVSGLVSLINPYGLTYWAYLFDATTMSRTNIQEWQPLNLMGPGALFLGFKILLLLTLIAIVARAARKDLPDFTMLVTLLVTAALGVRVLRLLTFFVIASAPFVWSWLVSAWDRLDRAQSGTRRLSGRVPPLAEALYYGGTRGVLLLGSVMMLTTVPMRIVLFADFPVRAVDFIAQNHLKGNLLVPFNYGSYAIWRLYPDCRVAMDGRFETVYEDTTYHAVRNFFGGAPGWADFLDGFPHDIILAPRTVTLERNMATRPDWVVAYEDKIHRVYVRAGQHEEWSALGPPRRVDPFSTVNKPRFAPAR